MPLGKMSEMEAGKRLPFKRRTVGLLSAFLWDGVCVGVCGCVCWGRYKMGYMSSS